MAILPELALLVGATSCFFLSLGKNLDATQVKSSAVFFGFITFFCSLISLNQNTLMFWNSYQIDAYSQFFKVMIGFAVMMSLIFSQKEKDISLEVRPEYYCFLFLSALGLTMLVSSVELIAIFISLELSSFALYILVPMRSDETGNRMQMEAGIKYILFGVMATGFMLYGMSYVFGLTGSTYLKDIVPGLQRIAGQPAVLFAVLLILGGFFYKLAVFPMHFWVPDIYQGAANETTGFIATVPKLGAVAMLIRFMTLTDGIDHQIMTNLFIVLALASMFYGNLSALVQKDVKRMLGFSGISHAGFVMLGLLTMSVDGYATAIYYISGYVLMNLACFLVLSNVSAQGENLGIEDLNGLHKRQPALAFILAVGLFALAGIPPFVGFMGKFMLLAGVFKQGYDATEGIINQGYLWVVILAAINTGIAIFYYLSVVRAAYTTDPEDRPDVAIDGLTKTAGFFLVLLIILMGALPSKIVAFAGSAVKAIM